jgi:hypothetical protein
MILSFGLDNIHSRVKKTAKKVFALISYYPTNRIVNQ